MNALRLSRMLMDDGEFQWDDVKAAENYANMASPSKPLERFSRIPSPSIGVMNVKAYDEDQHIAVGIAEGRLIDGACTMRGDVIRIISARGAEPFERRKHHEENG